jgi:hypothetical protein
MKISIPVYKRILSAAVEEDANDTSPGARERFAVYGDIFPAATKAFRSKQKITSAFAPRLKSVVIGFAARLDVGRPEQTRPGHD